MADHVPGPIESLLANGTRELAAVAALVSLHPCKCFVGLTAVRTLVARGVEVRVQVVAQMGRTLKQVVQLSMYNHNCYSKSQDTFCPCTKTISKGKLLAFGFVE